MTYTATFYPGPGSRIFVTSHMSMESPYPSHLHKLTYKDNATYFLWKNLLTSGSCPDNWVFWTDANYTYKTFSNTQERTCFFLWLYGQCSIIFPIEEHTLSSLSWIIIHVLFQFGRSLAWCRGRQSQYLDSCMRCALGWVGNVCILKSMVDWRL